MRKIYIDRVMTFNPETKRFAYNGKTNYNKGDALEAAATESVGERWYKDSVPFDKGSDIESLSVSVKSPRATLANALHGSKEEQISEFLAKTASREFWFVVDDNGEQLMCYQMNKDEFASFLRSEFWKLDGGKLRQTVSYVRAMWYLDAQTSKAA